MATVTFSGARANAQAVHAGLNAVCFHVSASASFTAGDTGLIGRIPHGAIPLEAIWYPGLSLGANSVIKIGTSASNELFFASATQSIAVRSTVRLGPTQQISLSDDAMPRYDNVTLVAGAGTSLGHIGDLVLYYVMPGVSF